MKKFLLCLLLLSVFAVLTSCETIGKVSDSQLRSDMELLDEFQSGYRCRYVNGTPFKIKKLEIERRQTTPEDREDYILCNVQAQNEHFEAEFAVSMYYDHYDTGGWILSHGSVERKNIFPIAPVNASEIPSICLDPYESATDLHVETDNTYISSVTLYDNVCMINYHYEDGVLDFAGYTTISFENNNWSEINGDDFETTDFNVNWANVSTNTFHYPYDSYYYWNTERSYTIDSGTYRVSDIDTKIDKYNVNFTSCDWENKKVSGELIIDAGDYYYYGPDHKDAFDITKGDIMLTIPFDTTFEDKTGKFFVYYQDELETGIKCFTTADCHAEITYSFHDDSWRARFFVDSLYNNPIEVKKFTKSVFGFSRT